VNADDVNQGVVTATGCDEMRARAVQAYGITDKVFEGAFNDVMIMKEFYNCRSIDF
jgi:hypothetical protein